MKKSLIVILALVLVFAFSATALAADSISWTVNSGSIANGGSEEIPSAGTVNFGVSIGTVDGGTVVSTSISASPALDSSTPGTNSATGSRTFAVNAHDITLTVDYGVDTDADTFADVPRTASITIHLYIGDNDATLDSLILTAGTDSGLGESTFSSSGFGSAGDYDTVNLTGHVDDAATNVLVAAVANGTGATVTVGGVANSKTLTFSDDSDATTNVVVTAQNGRTKTYDLTVKQDWDVVSIGGLKVGSVEFYDEPITNDEDVTYYYPYGSDEGDDFTFSFVDLIGSFEGEDAISIGSDDGDVIEVSGDTATSFTLKFIADPDGADFDLEITVEALDGTDLTFNLELEEAEPVFLDDLDIMIGTTSTSSDLDFTMLPSSFDDETFTYYVFAPWSDAKSSYETSVNVYFSVSYDEDYTIAINGDDEDADDNGDFVLVGNVLDGKDELFTITVTDDEDNSQDYDVYVFYGEEDAEDDADLADLDVKYGTSYKTTATLSPSFSSSTLTYTASLPLNTKSAKIVLDLSDSDAIIICNGEQESSTITVSDLKTGANTFKIVIMAADYDTTKTYNLTINVGTGGLLTNLVFTPISGSLNVSPSFSGDVYNYVANVANGVSAIYVTPTAIDSSYTISVYKGASDYKTVTSGKTSSAITLNEGLNEIKVYVYKSGSSKTYTLSIYRQPATTKYVVSNQAITVNGVNKTLYAVNINGNNYLKLRDVAYMLSGTTKQFNVTFSTSSNTAAITSLTAYVNDPSNPVNQPIVLSNPQLSGQLVTLNGKAAYPIAYNVAGSNYVNLRQICAMLDIGLTYSSATNTISITTANSYTPGM